MAIQFSKMERQSWPKNHKQCNRCGKLQKHESFFVVPKSPDGRHGTCKECLKNKVPLVKEIHPENHRKCLVCGEVKVISSFHKHNLTKSGHSTVCKSCKVQISKKEYENKPNESCLYFAAKSRAKKKGLEFNIELSDIIIPTICPVLGVTMVINGPYAPSIDRIDSNKGYIKGNIRVISKRANALKSNASLREIEMVFEDLCKLNEYVS